MNGRPDLPVRVAAGESPGAADALLTPDVVSGDESGRVLDDVGHVHRLHGEPSPPQLGRRFGLPLRRTCELPLGSLSRRCRQGISKWELQCLAGEVSGLLELLMDDEKLPPHPFVLRLRLERPEHLRAPHQSRTQERLYGDGIIIWDACMRRLHAARCSMAEAMQRHATVLAGSIGHAKSSSASMLPAAVLGGVFSNGSHVCVTVKMAERRCSHSIHSGVRKLPSVGSEGVGTGRGYGGARALRVVLCGTGSCGRRPPGQSYPTARRGGRPDGWSGNAGGSAHVQAGAEGRREEPTT
ncbi:hypothetical protein SAMN05660748_2905 [Blastococcus aggregatus]|uniref:Uncharacterized protein n=1 Tax=Blastococcus aggregatus TaxID=38502 RepID=A0A285V7S2_9ACTN|nr:hypothetical protein SAMN05660748_2905 [Blastococcus aggregatus]